MRESAKRLRALLMRIPLIYVAIGVLVATLLGGWAGRGWFGDQVALPRAVAANAQSISALEDRVNTRLNDMSQTVDRLVESQSRLTARLETLICILDAERRNLSVFGCPR